MLHFFTYVSFHFFSGVLDACREQSGASLSTKMRETVFVSGAAVFLKGKGKTLMVRST